LEVGYKWYQAKHIRPLFPFGYGLSYTRFSFSRLTITPSSTDGLAHIEVAFSLTDRGTRAGAETAEVYLGFPASTGEPPERLVGWTKIGLSPGETRRVTVTIDPQSPSHPLSFWNSGAHRWNIADGTYQIYVGGSSQNIPLRSTLEVQSKFPSGI
jgi:beta-glucosidase